MILFNALLLILWAHPFHVSVCEIAYNENEKALQVSHRIFMDDLENALSKMSEEKIYMQRTESFKINQWLEKYFHQNFAIWLEGEQVQAEYLGYEIENDVVWCYLEASPVDQFKNIRLKNSVLLEIFDDQQNIIHVKAAGEVRSVKLNSRNNSGAILFK